MLFKDKKMKYTIIIFIIIFIVLIGLFIGNNIKKNKTNTKKEPTLSIKTESNIFKIDSILLYSSANAINNSQSDSNKWNLDIYQYTDISININNMVSYKELTNKNTVKKIYIDNFKLQSEPSRGTPKFYYKNPNDFGIANINDENLIEDSIEYKVTTTNDEIDFSKPTFYTDCSNPLTLSYVNKDINKNYVVQNNNSTVIFDGSLLRDSTVLLSTIESTVSFTVHIINYLDEEFTCEVRFDIPLKDDTTDIYSGSYTKEITKLHSSKFYKNEKMD